ncbi:MAG TPA: serine/threonine-protein kinase [Polyangia bacterium]
MTDAVTQPAPPVDGAARIGFIGKRLGRFLITGELGRGGMATVYRARDPELGRDVAIKVMHGFFAGRADLEARFRREANAVATIRHPSILNVFDFASPVGEEPGYIVSELIEGPGLRAVVEGRGGRLYPELAALVVARVAEALGAAHAAGIVHRDVKPDNVLIDRAGGRARLVLTDFGVAHIGSLDTMTATGAVLGSPAYMSPEQARSDDVGATSDVFSLGVMLYQLCTGHLPFPGKDPLAVITAILRGHYRRPGEIEPRLGHDLERVIARCLQASPAARYPNGAAVAAALREALQETRTAAHLEDEEAVLRRFLEQPDDFEATLGAPVARIATSAAERARKGGQIPRALAEVGRALAYVPDHADAKALLERLGSRRRFRAAGRRGLVLAGALVLVGGSALAWRHLANREPRLQTTGAAQGAAAVPASVPPPPSPPPAVPPPTVAAPAPGPVPVAAVPAAPPKSLHARSRRRAAVASADHASKTPEPEVASADKPSAPPVIAAEAPRQPAPEAVAAAPTGQTGAEKPVSGPAKASMVLRASYGFCEPSLDAHPPSLRANYSGLVPGPHEIFCTLPQGGPKLHVATYDVRPGARTSLVIVPGPDGRPIIGRSE